jgi:hypothetical protein
VGVSLGYKGFCKLNTNLIPFTREGLTIRPQTLRDEGIHGGGAAGADARYYSEHLAATGPIFFDGDFDTYMYDGAGAYRTAVQALIAAAIDQGTRESGLAIIINPGTTKAWEYPGTDAVCENKAIVNTLRISGSAEDYLRVSANIMATTRKDGGSAPGAATYVYETAGELLTGGDFNPCPYFGASLTVGSTGDTLTNKITEWELSVNNNAVRIVTFDGTRYAHDIGMGMMLVEGSVTYYGPAGAFTAGGSMTHGGSFTIALNSGYTLICPFLQLTEVGIEGAGPNEIIKRTLNFFSLSDGTNASIYHS